MKQSNQNKRDDIIEEVETTNVINVILEDEQNSNTDIKIQINKQLSNILWYLKVAYTMGIGVQTLAFCWVDVQTYILNE